jgi:hypothetical protein
MVERPLGVEEVRDHPRAAEHGGHGWSQQLSGLAHHVEQLISEGLTDPERRRQCCARC